MWGLLSKVFGNREDENIDSVEHGHGGTAAREGHREEEEEEEDVPYSEDFKVPARMPTSTRNELIGGSDSDDAMPLFFSAKEAQKRQQQSVSSGEKSAKKRVIKVKKSRKAPASPSRKSKKSEKKKSKTKKQKLPLTDQEKRAKAVQTTEEQVLAASVLVAQVLYDGPWPSPVRSQNEEDMADEESDNFMATFSEHRSHMSMVGASLQQFCRDTVLPSMLQAIVDIPPNDYKKNSPRGPLIGTMLLLREVMVQNSPEIFGLPNLPRGNGFGVQVMATSIIIQALANESASTQRHFMDAIADYDAGEDNFGEYLEEPTGERDVDSAEDSFWRHARLHPLRLGHNHGVAIPEANSIHVTVLQKAPES